MSNLPDFGPLLKVLEFLGIVAAALLFMFKLGGKMDRLASSIDHLAKVFEDHEDRLRVLESARVAQGRLTTC